MRAARALALVLNVVERFVSQDLGFRRLCVQQRCVCESNSADSVDVADRNARFVSVARAVICYMYRCTYVAPPVA